MQRRDFLLAAGALGAAAASGAGFWRWQQIATEVRAPGRDAGHLLRGPREWPVPRGEILTDVAILGSGAAGLFAAWRLSREGFKRYLVVDGPEQYGNLAGGAAGAFRYPTGAHYLPLPSRESTHVREMLSALGIILDGADSEQPYYDERYLVHAPESRVLVDGIWHDGLLPPGALDADANREQQRFFAYVDVIARARGSDGRRAFAMPIAESSTDGQWREFDMLTFAAWLDREGYRSTALRGYLDYACRDDYGRGAAEVSAYAGLHYFASRAGEARNAERGAVLTWPDGLAALATRLARDAGLAMRGTVGDSQKPALMNGSVVALRETRDGIVAQCIVQRGDGLDAFVVKARRAICAMPLHVLAHVYPGLADHGFDARRHMPPHAPWLVSNFVLSRFPAELAGAPLAWDNIVLGSPSLGYVVSTHQDFRAGPPPRTVFTAYHALADMTPEAARAWMMLATPAELLDLASADLRKAYGWKLAACCERAEITLRGHAMAVPLPGYLSNPGLRALREADGRILFAHSDLSGYSVFEEAAWWGDRAARRVLQAHTASEAR